MAIQTHERTDRFIEYTGKYGTIQEHVISLYNPDGRDKMRDHAERKAEEPDVTYVAIVTQLATWRGKNGKRTYTETAREVIKDAQP
jgi:hypothetical protein